jgi:hypothetical protein
MIDCEFIQICEQTLKLPPDFKNIYKPAFILQTKKQKTLLFYAMEIAILGQIGKKVGTLTHYLFKVFNFRIYHYFNIKSTSVKQLFLLFKDWSGRNLAHNTHTIG